MIQSANQSINPSTHQPSQNGRQKRPFFLYAILSVVALLLISAVSLLFSPIGQRYIAQPASAPPVTGVTDIYIEADAIQNHLFTPSVIEVEAGTTVTWHFSELDENGQPVEHNVIFEGFGSPVQATGTYTVTFEEPGSYSYTCTLHAFMDGRVEVVQ